MRTDDSIFSYRSVDRFERRPNNAQVEEDEQDARASRFSQNVGSAVCGRSPRPLGDVAPLFSGRACSDPSTRTGRRNSVRAPEGHCRMSRGRHRDRRNRNSRSCTPLLEREVAQFPRVRVDGIAMRPTMMRVGRTTHHPGSKYTASCRPRSTTAPSPGYRRRARMRALPAA